MLARWRERGECAKMPRNSCANNAKTELHHIYQSYVWCSSVFALVAHASLASGRQHCQAATSSRMPSACSVNSLHPVQLHTLFFAYTSTHRCHCSVSCLMVGFVFMRVCASNS
jgi:hypothetical protein